MSIKAAVIGLDGATFEIIDLLIERGALPNLKRLIEEGAAGPLRSSITPNSFPGWTSASTGTSEGRHGIFMPLVRREDNFTLKAMSTLDIKTKTIWELLSERGHPVGVINDPCSYPPIVVNGFLVCGMLWPGGDQPYTYPITLASELEEAVPGYIVDVNLHGKDKEQIAAELFRSLELRQQAASYLMKRYPWDLYWVVFTESDRAQHRFWAAFDQSHPRYDEQPASLRTAIFEIYQKLDAAVGKLISEMDTDTTVFIVSDHGFGPFYTAFEIPRWLLDEGYLVERGEKAKLKSALRRIGILDEVASVYRAVRKPFEKEIGYGAAKLRSQAATTQDYFATLDWSQTRAYYTLDGGIRINLAGREPYGIVTPTAAEKLKQEIKAKLSAQKFPNGAPVFRYILTQEEAFDGPYRAFAPDLIISINYDGYCGPLKGEKYLTPSNHNTGEHTPDGVFIAWGKNIRGGTRIVGANLRDVTPTVLFHLDEALTPEMDGRVLAEIFTAEFSATRTVRRTGTSYREPVATADEGLFDDENVAEKLRSLGYIQ
ncbi:MAG: alkaline phosphatase family protein [Acidobacteriota bacterium]